MRAYAGRMIACKIHNNSIQNITEHTNNGKSKDSIGSKKHITVMTLCSQQPAYPCSFNFIRKNIQYIRQ